MRIALFGNSYQTKKSAQAVMLLSVLYGYGAEVYIDEEFRALLPESAVNQYFPKPLSLPLSKDMDMVISMGGDGTFLQSAAHVGSSGVPMLGVNTGRLGFLADVKPEEIHQTMSELFRGDYLVEERSVLTLEIDGGQIATSPFALNDIAILKHDSSAMIAIRTYVNGTLLTTYQADGLVIATPTGSTAYSLSIGGPIMVPDSGVMVLTPIAPHSLNVRPIVLCDSWDITLEVESRSHNFLIAIDGRSASYPEHTHMRIHKAAYNIKVVKRKNHAYFETLRQKMMWGGSLVE